MAKSKTVSEVGLRTAPLPKFDAFWHLQAIGLLDRTPPLPPADKRPDTGIWELLRAKPKATVCIIDTGVSMHPYLDGKLSPPNNIDLTGAPFLVRPVAGAAPGILSALNQGLLASLKLGAPNVPPVVASYLKKLVDANKDRRTIGTGAPDTSNQKFSAHGTSCAGLVAASELNDPDTLAATRPYYRGVDPVSEIMSITTSFSPRPEMLTLAFLLAESLKADVILFPRGLPREILAKTLDTGWLALRQTILAVSKKRPVVCAAGNESDNVAIAPACFAAVDNGIIGVAAMNCYGVRSSYSNFGKGVTVAAPSDDAEIFNRDQARLDKSDRFYRNYPYAAYLEIPPIKELKFGEAVIRAIDVPGPFGFSDAGGDAESSLATTPESYFTEFGGTSAAASVVAGVAALMQRAAKNRPGGAGLDGVQIRALIEKTANKGAPKHLADGAAVIEARKDDWVNGRQVTFKQAYGAGLISADAAVKKVLAMP
jgi:subtilisin family serine protease